MHLIDELGCGEIAADEYALLRTVLGSSADTVLARGAEAIQTRFQRQ